MRHAERKASVGEARAARGAGQSTASAATTTETEGPTAMVLAIPTPPTIRTGRIRRPLGRPPRRPVARASRDA